MTASFWNPSHNASDFCFIDLIKGIVPLDFSNLVQIITNDGSITISLMAHIFHHIFTSVSKIWIDRCDLFANAEKLANITLSHKKNNWITSGFLHTPLPSSLIPPSIISSFRYGNDWSNFWTGSNQALTSGWLSFLFS